MSSSRRSRHVHSLRGRWCQVGLNLLRGTALAEAPAVFVVVAVVVVIVVVVIDDELSTLLR